MRGCRGPWLLVCALLGWVGTSQASPMIHTFSDTQPMIDWPSQKCEFQLPGDLPFAAFRFQGTADLDSLQSIAIKLTLEDGDTGVGELDYNNLTLSLDGIDTGIALNGFAKGQELELALGAAAGESGWLTRAASERILAELKTDGELIASITDATPGDNCVNLYSAFDTTLTLTGLSNPEPVCEPASILVWLFAGGCLVRRRRIG